MGPWFATLRFTQAVLRGDDATAAALVAHVRPTAAERSLGQAQGWMVVHLIQKSLWSTAEAWLVHLPAQLHTWAQRHDHPWDPERPIAVLEARSVGFGSWFIEQVARATQDGYEGQRLPTADTAYAVLEGFLRLGLRLDDRYCFNRHSTTWDDYGEPDQTLSEALESRGVSLGLLQARQAAEALAVVLGEAEEPPAPVPRRPRL